MKCSGPIAIINGNPIADGPSEVTFRILDAAGAVLYEERQAPDVVRGGISALVGNGLTAAGAPTGGIPDGLFAPGSARYLEAEIDGQPPTAPLEIASVPYALYAGEALRVAAGGVAFESLGEGVVEDLAAALAEESGGVNEVIVRSDLATMYRDPSAAAKIGVATTISHSVATTVQGVLEDLDGAIGAEKTAREAADAAIAGQIQVVADVVAPLSAMRVGAWCHIASCLTAPATGNCGNASAAQTGLSACRVTFGAAMPGAEYAVVTTPSAAVSARDAGGFTVDCGGIAGCAFDVIVMAP